MKQELRKKLNSLIISLTAIVVSIFVFSYAWFVDNEETQMENLTIGAVRANNIQVSEDGEGDWGDVLELGNDGRLIFNDEVTSDGKTFYKALAKDNNGNPTSFTPAIENIDYAAFDLWFKNDSDVVLFLDDSSEVTPGTPNFIGSTVERKSVYGDYSKDLIAASVRIAFYRYVYDETTEEYNLESDPLFIWAPNKNYEIYKENGTYKYSLYSTNPQSYNHIKVDSKFIFEEEETQNVVETIRASYAQRKSNGDPAMITIKTNGEEEGKGGIRVYVWVEGNDRDTVNAVRGGKFKFTLSFTGLNKKENENIPDVSINGNKIEGFTAGMEYSLDNGKTWTGYSEMLSFSSDSVVYVRYAETSDLFASDYVVLDFGGSHE